MGSECDLNGSRNFDVTNRSLFEFNSPDETQSFVSQIFCDHRFDVAGGGQAFDTQISHLRAGNLSFNTFAYSRAVSVDPGCLANFYLLQMIQAGKEVLRYGNLEFDLVPGSVSVISPGIPVKKFSTAGTRKLLIRIERDLIERSCIKHLGYDIRKSLHFDVGQPTNADTEVLKNLITFLYEQMSGGNGLFRSPLMLASMEQMVATSLLLSQRHNYFDELNSSKGPIVPRFVRRIEDYIEAYADQPITVADMAAHAGVSTRSLFAGFKKFRNTSPMLQLRYVRLQNVRRDFLERGHESVSVTEVATRWGFMHLGRFAEQYKRYFGESPSDTLKRSR